MEAVPSVVTADVVAEKTAEVDPAGTVTEAGTANTELLSERATTVPPAGAALLRFTVQLAEELEASEAGLQTRLLGTLGEVRLSEKLTDAPEPVAVMEAVPSVVTADALAVKTAEVAPAGTVTEAGTAKTALLSERATTVPAAGAALLRVTVQLAKELEARDAGLHTRPVGTVGEVRLREKLTAVPESVAVMDAIASVVTADAVAGKTAEVDPAGTVTEAGTPSAELLLESATMAPPAGADPVRVTVHVERPTPVMVLGSQPNADTPMVATGTMTTPLEP
jgi:hypothetical protein